MIRYVQDDNLWCPYVICDHCNERIEDAKQGNALYNPDKGIVYFTHKKCNHAWEHINHAESSNGSRACWFADELEAFILRLGINLAMAKAEGTEGLSVWVGVRGKILML